MVQSSILPLPPTLLLQKKRRRRIIKVEGSQKRKAKRLCRERPFFFSFLCLIQGTHNSPCKQSQFSSFRKHRKLPTKLYKGSNKQRDFEGEDQRKQRSKKVFRFSLGPRSLNHPLIISDENPEDLSRILMTLGSA